MIDRQHIRNFAIIAHVDHGKSTLADRFIQRCGGLSEREMGDQVLDSMDLERERGITIKAQTVSLAHRARDGERYRLNLVDTPGHVDFSYEVSRSLAACEGAVLVVDASQGVEAQSVANCYSALDCGLTVLPALNKIDLAQADPERVAAEIESIIGLDTEGCCRISAKRGDGVDDLLEAIVAAVPPPSGDADADLQALIFDSWFDNYLGVVSMIKLAQGTLRTGDRICASAVGKAHVVDALGVFTPHRREVDALRAGDIGFVVAGIKAIGGAPVGDTLIHASASTTPALPGFQALKPQVYTGLFASSAGDYETFRDALGKLSLNDAALVYEPETSAALGLGFRCGFLGLLHMDVVRERLEREYGLDLVATAPTVAYRVFARNGDVTMVDNPAEMPDRGVIERIEEPMAAVHVLTPESYLGAVIGLCERRRGAQESMHFTGRQVSLRYALPMSEVVLDFFDRLKSLSQGFASLDYRFSRFAPADLVRLDLLINGERVGALSSIVHRDAARQRGIALTERMRELIPRQMFEVAIQCAIGSRVIARTSVKALRKNVTAKCYGGDVTRKRKLLEKQKAGKKRMRHIGRVDIPSGAFLDVLKIGE